MYIKKIESSSRSGRWSTKCEWRPLHSGLRPSIEANGRKIAFFLATIIFTSLTYGKCNRPDRKHANENVVRCTYQQEDIFRCYGEKTNCYKNEQRRRECFFCGCPIEEHTKTKNGKKKPKKTRSGKKD